MWKSRREAVGHNRKNEHKLNKGPTSRKRANGRPRSQKIGGRNVGLRNQKGPPKNSTTKVMRGRVPATYQRGRIVTTVTSLACVGQFVVVMQTIAVACTAVAFFLSALHSTSRIALLLLSFSSAVWLFFSKDKAGRCMCEWWRNEIGKRTRADWIFICISAWWPRVSAGSRLSAGEGCMRGNTPANRKIDEDKNNNEMLTECRVVTCVYKYAWCFSICN